MKVLVFGAHPDDPETGVGGAIARYADAGHDVVMAYLTAGEAGIAGKTPAEAAEARRLECEAAARSLGATTAFLGQIDGQTEVNREAYDAVQTFYRKANPDVVFTHWPIDSHRDHRACSALTLDAWLEDPGDTPLYYYEVMTGVQTRSFTPTDYVGIDTVAARKHEACLLHASQDMATYLEHHRRMESSRGMESGVARAEAFRRHVPGPAGNLP